MLDDYIRLHERVINQSNQLKDLKRTIGVSTSKITQVNVKNERKGAFDDKYIKILELSEELDQQTAKLKHLRESIFKRFLVMCKTGKTDGAFVLKEIYISGKTFEQLANDLTIEQDTLIKLHDEAIKHFESSEI